MKTPIKSFEIIKEMYVCFVKKYRDLEPKLMICEKEDFDNVETALKALKILKSKGVAVGMLQLEEVGLKEYNDFIGDKKLYLTKEQFNFLKEVLL